MSDQLKDKQLDLLIAMDAARDSVDEDSDPMMMFRHIVRLLKVYFDADAACVLLVDVKTGETELVAATGMPQDMAIDLAREAMDFEDPKVLSSSAWKHSLGLRIFIDREKIVAGGIVLTRDSSPFTEGLPELLKLAESQIDSAVVQARTMWRLAERNRELEAIYQIDRLRDDATDEETLYLSFTKLLLKHFQANYCQIVLGDTETGTMQTRTLINDAKISEIGLAKIPDLTRDIQTVTLIPTPQTFGTIQLIAAPFIVSGQRLGSVVVGRDNIFAIRDTRLMLAMTSQMDSAIAKSRTALELAQRKRELEAIYQIDRIRDKIEDFDEMLHQVLLELCDVVASETGYLLLFNSENHNKLEVRASTRAELVNSPEYMTVIRRVSQEALDNETVVTYNDLEGEIRSIIAIPLVLNTQVMGVFGSINSINPRGFTSNDGRIITAITSQVDTAVFERLERRRMRQVLGRSVDPKVLEALLTRADNSLFAGERVVLTVLYADLRGSTEWAERTEPEELVAMLNVFLGMMTDVIFKYGGTLDKFVGDEVIALFGTPLPMPDHASNATHAALEMQVVHEKMRAEFIAQGREMPQMGIGINSGEVIAGEFGPPMRTDFTAMGRVMNLGARLCSAAKGNQIVISESTFSYIDKIARVNELEPQPLKGIQRTVQTYELLGLSK